MPELPPVSGKNAVHKAGSIQNHRQREKGCMVYPVHSRRSGGLSIGVNLFPDQKRCSFDCPYCEVFPFSTNAVFSGGQMEAELRAVLAWAKGQNTPVRDICFSGNGEPSLSGVLPEALRRAGAVRSEIVSGAKLVLITNGTGLLEPEIFELLRDAAAGPLSLAIWLKLDAGTPEWYTAMSRSQVPFEKLTAVIKKFSACAPVTIQTMLCAIDGKAPPPGEAKAWEKLAVELALGAATGGAGGGIRGVQIYGKARPSPDDPKAQALPAAFLEERAVALRYALAAAFSKAPAIVPPVEAYP
jgi:histidinol dehydrogenase